VTVATTGGGANPWDGLGDVGLEDVDASDIQMPRLTIDHDNAVFKDSSTGQSFPELNAVVLGLVKQRIMWDSQIDEGDKPQCKSPNHNEGYPQMRTDIPARKQFPWDKSNFNIADYPPNAEGQIILPCSACKFKDWGKEEKPPCAEQFTYVLLYDDGEGQMRPGLVSFQRSGAKTARTYAGTFSTRRQPMFTVWTKILLTAESKGKTRYATPSFKQGAPTDQAEWSAYADNYRSAREFLHEPPRPATKDEDDKAAAARSRATPASATAATKLADDDPWASAAPAAPVATPASAGGATPVATPSSPDDDLPF
jgi:hypothetical protein